MKLYLAIVVAFAATADPIAATTPQRSCPVASSVEKEVWPLKLEDAVGIALDNSEFACVIRFGKQSVPVCNCFHPPEKTNQPRERPAFVDARSIVIRQVNPNASPYRFKSEAMALVRSVEQQYWSFAQVSGALSAAKEAIKVANKVVASELDDLAEVHGSAVNLAEASDQLRQLEQNLNERTLQVAAAEQSLRAILGLPGSDGRQVFPVTPPTEARLAFDWETCVRTMMHEQPDVIQRQALTRLAERDLLIAKHRRLPHLNLDILNQMNALGEILESPNEALMSAFLEGLDVGSPEKFLRLDMRPSKSGSRADEVLALLASDPGTTTQSSGADMRQYQSLRHTRQQQYKLLRSRASLRRVIRQTTQSLEQALLEVDAAYKSYVNARIVRTTTAKRLEAQRAYWQVGRITPDRFLDAVEHYAAAVSAEHQELAAYNSAIALLSEWNGTLLAEHNIIIFAD
jgi:hypothetical protein